MDSSTRVSIGAGLTLVGLLQLPNTCKESSWNPQVNEDTTKTA